MVTCVIAEPWSSLVEGDEGSMGHISAIDQLSNKIGYSPSVTFSIIVVWGQI